jgi:hypothetical protein
VSKIANAMIARGDPPPDKGTHEWDMLVARITKEKGVPICGKLKRGRVDNDRADKGYPCENPRMRNGKCRLHGGKTPRNRYDVALEGKPLQAMYHRALHDPKLLSLNNEIAVTVAKLEQILARLGSTESARGWGAMADCLEAVQSAIEKEKPKIVASNLEKALNLVRDGLGEEALWHEYILYSNQLRRMVAAESRHRALLQLTITPERMMLFIERIIGWAERRLDPDLARELLDEVRAIKSSEPLRVVK